MSESTSAGSQRTPVGETFAVHHYCSLRIDVLRRTECMPNRLLGWFTCLSRPRNQTGNYGFLPFRCRAPHKEMPPGARSASAKKDFPVTAALSVYVGHNGLMDFAIENRFQGDAKAHREAIILACASKMFFCQRAENHWCVAAAVDNRIDGPRGLHAEGGTGWVDCR